MKIATCTACIGHQATIKALQGIVKRLSNDLQDAQGLVKRMSRDLLIQDATIKELKSGMAELSERLAKIEALG